MQKTTSYIIDEAKKRNIKIELYDAKTNTIALIKGDKKIFVSHDRYGWNVGLSSFILSEKMFTNRLLEEAGVSVSNGDVLYNAKEVKWQWFLNKFKFPFVIKQHDGSKGKNFYKIQDKNDLIKAHRSLKRRDIQFIVEDFFEGNEYRFLVVKNKIVAVANRVPAYITGDGKHTIADLIAIKI